MAAVATAPTPVEALPLALPRIQPAPHPLHFFNANPSGQGRLSHSSAPPTTKSMAASFIPKMKLVEPTLTAAAAPASNQSQQQLAPPPTLREIMSSFASHGAQDRTLLIALLREKTAEDKRIAKVWEAQTRFIDAVVVRSQEQAQQGKRKRKEECVEVRKRREAFEKEEREVREMRKRLREECC